MDATFLYGELLKFQGRHFGYNDAAKVASAFDGNL